MSKIVRRATFWTACLAYASHGCFAQTYTVEFDATWSELTHPSAYVSSAHFSPLVGAIHNSSVSLWEEGGIASSGIELMAELGSTRSLLAEIGTFGDAANQISGVGIGTPASTSVDFQVTPERSLVSLVTRIAPSPDWFVGVSGLDLFEEGVWSREVVVDLFAYDAGTDSGVDLVSPNDDTSPAETISLLGAPFAGLPSLGTFTFTLQAASGDFDGNNEFNCADIDALIAEIAAGTNNQDFDVSGDGIVDQNDRDVWLMIADEIPLSSGDVNLDHAVDSTDLGLLLNNFGETGDFGFCGGDIDASLSVDSTDLGLLLNDFGSSGEDSAAATAVAVPEPQGIMVMLVGQLLVGLYVMRRRRS